MKDPVCGMEIGEKGEPIIHNFTLSNFDLIWTLSNT